MNRFRLNQILEVLLFPVCDPILASKDFLFEEFNAYQNFLDIQGYPLQEVPDFYFIENGRKVKYVFLSAIVFFPCFDCCGSVPADQMAGSVQT